MGSTESKVRAVALPSDTLEQLRCCLCKHHLSCSPIRILSDGNSVCGRCPVTDHNTPICRQLALEAALAWTTFPCRYKQYGCCAKLLFGCAIDHEARCEYHPFACPTLPFSTCSWQGSVVQVQDHFNKSHLLHMTSRPQIRFDVDKSNEGVLLAVQGKGMFLIKYLYDAATTSLRYDVRYFSSSSFNGAYKIRLLDPSNPDNNINLKGSKCLPFMRHMNMRNAPILTIGNFLSVLGNSNSFTVEIDLPLLEPTYRVPRIQRVVDYELLESLRCSECQSYLTAPIFDGPKGAVGPECSQNYPLTRNDELNRLVIVTNYPCRWNDCNFIGKGDLIRFHEAICAFQPQKCPSTTCKLPLVAAQAFLMKFHLLLHGFQYFTKRDVHTSAFRYNDARVLVTTTKNNEIIVISHRVAHSQECTTHTFSLHSCRTSLTNVIAYVCVKHSHCKLKSRRFALDCTKELSIKTDMLPKCFTTYKKMSIVVEI